MRANAAAAKRTSRGSAGAPAHEPARRARIPEQTREKLVAAAADLFAEHGLEGASLDAICERAGYTRGAFYVHFSSRDDLVGAVVEKAILELLGAIVSEQPDDLHAVIDAFVRALSSARAPTWRRVRLSQLFEACARSAELSAKCLTLLAQAKVHVTAAVRHSQSSGIVRPDAAAEAVAEILLALALGALAGSQLGAPYEAPAVQAELVRMLAAPAAAKPSSRPGPRKARRRDG